VRPDTTCPITAHQSYWSRWQTRLRHFRRPGDLWTFLHLGVALSFIPVPLAVLGLPRLLARLAARGQRSAPTVSLEQAQVLARYADFWLRLRHPRNPCLRRSLVLFGRLYRGGLPVTFCLGIDRAGISAPVQSVTGHAWLELGGQVILEPTAAVADQVRTFCFPPSALKGTACGPDS
jgi:hypothetical protein